MEDVLKVYTRPFNELEPLLCLDEMSKQQIKEEIESLPIKKGYPRRYDDYYVRNGTSNLFILFEPLKGWRKIKVTRSRKRQDWAILIKEIVDKIYPKAKKIILVMDNLNIHSIASLYETFYPEEASRLADKLEIHYTPKHGSWLNMAEIECSALVRQCLDRRIADRLSLIKEVKAWETDRNKHHVVCNWQFTTKDARIKLKKLYPDIKKKSTNNSITEY